MSKPVDIYRAWSFDWSKSYRFPGSIINAKFYWKKFKKEMEQKLGKNWGWELAINDNKINTDLN